MFKRSKIVYKSKHFREFSQVIDDYDFDKDGKLNMAEYKQYLIHSEDGDETIEDKKKVGEKKTTEEDEEDDEVVFVKI